MRSPKIAVRENLDPQKFSTIRLSHQQQVNTSSFLQLVWSLKQEAIKLLLVITAPPILIKLPHIMLYMWQSWIEIEYYSIVCFKLTPSLMHVLSFC